jgi:hypothetical protein
LTVIDGEIVTADLDATEARALTDRIRQTLTISHDLITAAYSGRAWVALGYDTWDAYCGGEFESSRMVRLDREQRREIVADMRSTGMSTRAIASGLGVDQKTVVNDLHAGEELSSPDAAPPRNITGQDGKTYRPPAPAAPPTPQQRRPLQDAFFDAAMDLTRVIERLDRLASDDRFKSNDIQIANKHAADLTRANESLTALVQRLTALKENA